MKLIALIGLVSIEKINLTIELARHFSENNRIVTIIDNVARMRIDPVHLDGETLIRVGAIQGVLGATLPDLETNSDDVVIMAVSETVNVEDLMGMLDEVRQTGVDVVTVGLIDLRTCDCFPQTRQVIEMYADVVVKLPYQIEEVIAQLGSEHHG